MDVANVNQVNSESNRFPQIGPPCNATGPRFMGKCAGDEASLVDPRRIDSGRPIKAASRTHGYEYTICKVWHMSNVTDVYALLAGKGG